MTKALIVITSTLLFGILGVVVAWMIASTVVLASRDSYRLGETIVLSYTFGPLVGSAIGFVLSMIVVNLFVTSRRH